MKDGDWLRIAVLFAIAGLSIYAARKLENCETSQN